MARGSTNEKEGGKANVRRCYYEVLGVTRDASGDDLKKAYRFVEKLLIYISASS